MFSLKAIDIGHNSNTFKVFSLGCVNTCGSLKNSTFHAPQPQGDRPNTTMLHVCLQLGNQCDYNKGLLGISNSRCLRQRRCIYRDTHYPYQVYFQQIGNARRWVIHLPIHSASPDDRWVVIPFRHRYLYWWGDKKIEIAPLSKSVVLLRWSHFSWCTNLVSMMCLAYYENSRSTMYVPLTSFMAEENNCFFVLFCLLH